MITAKLRGGDALRKKLRTLARHPILAPAVTAAAHELAAKIEARAPVDTGAMRSRVYVSQKPVEGSGVLDVSAPVGEIVVDVFYAKFIEYGTSRMAAQPFVRPVIDENREQFKKDVGASCFQSIVSIVEGGAGKVVQFVQETNERNASIIELGSHRGIQGKAAAFAGWALRKLMGVSNEEFARNKGKTGIENAIFGARHLAKLYRNYRNKHK